jgi:glycosyltransferase involved in cell wall biosynthesis
VTSGVNARRVNAEIGFQSGWEGPAMTGLRIAMIGQRGVPATFGGIEHHVEEIGARLSQRGHEVTVFCRDNYVKEGRDEYRGMRLRHLGTIGTKHLDAIAHSAASTLRAMGDSFDVIHYHALGPGLVSIAPRLGSRAKVVQTIHGLDYDRAKWGGLARSVLKTAGWMSGHIPDATITVSRSLAKHYATRYGCRATYIPNGAASLRHRPTRRETERLGLQEGRYLLFVGRLVPEKHPDLLVRAFRRIPGDVRLVLAGGDSFTSTYVRSITSLAKHDERIILPGYVYGGTLESLYQNAAAFILPSCLEGLPLTLLEAIACGTPVVVSDIAPHREIVTDDGPGHHVVPCGNEDALSGALASVLQHGQAERQGAAALREEVLRTYNWDGVADATEGVYSQVVNGRRRRSPAHFFSRSMTAGSHIFTPKRRRPARGRSERSGVP